MALDLTIVYLILEGAGAAALAAVIGFAKAYFGSGEAFDPEKFGRTVLLGAILGGVAAFYGVPVLNLETFPAYVVLFPALVYFVDAAVKALARYLNELYLRSKLSP